MTTHKSTWYEFFSRRTNRLNPEFEWYTSRLHALNKMRGTPSRTGPDAAIGLPASAAPDEPEASQYVSIIDWGLTKDEFTKKRRKILPGRPAITVEVGHSTAAWEVKIAAVP